MTPCATACQASLSWTISQSLLRLISLESVMSSNHLILCYPLLLLPSIFASIRVLSNELALLNQVAKVLELRLQHQSFQWIFRIFFRIDWFDLLQSKGLSRVFSSTTVQKHQFFGPQSSLCPTLTSVRDCWKKHSYDCMDVCQQSDV